MVFPPCFESPPHVPEGGVARGKAETFCEGISWQVDILGEHGGVIILSERRSEEMVGHIQVTRAKVSRVPVYEAWDAVQEQNVAGINIGMNKGEGVCFVVEGCHLFNDGAGSGFYARQI